MLRIWHLVALLNDLSLPLIEGDEEHVHVLEGTPLLIKLMRQTLISVLGRQGMPPLHTLHSQATCLSLNRGSQRHYLLSLIHQPYSLDMVDS